MSHVPKLLFKAEYSTIRELDLSRNSIMELEARVFLSLPKLQKFVASQNRIKYLSGRIEACKNLQELLLDKNEL